MLELSNRKGFAKMTYSCTTKKRVICVKVEGRGLDTTFNFNGDQIRPKILSRDTTVT